MGFGPGHENTQDYFYIVLEFCAGGDLAVAMSKRRQEPVDEQLARCLVRQLAAGLCHCHPWREEPPATLVGTFSPSSTLAAPHNKACPLRRTCSIPHPLCTVL